MTSSDQVDVKKPFFIGLTGPAGSGKDLAAGAIDQALNSASCKKSSGKRVMVMSLADPLKMVCNVALGLTEEDMYTQEGKKRASTLYPHLTNREILQKVGTECFRNTFGGDVWVTALLHHARQKKVDVVIVPDVRFDNEAAMVKENGVLIHIIPSFPGYTPIVQSSHSSEAGVTIPPDCIVMNEGTKEEMIDQVLFYIQTLDLV